VGLAQLAGRVICWASAGHRGWITSLAIAPDGKNLASGGLDEAVYVWDTATGKELFQLGPDGGDPVFEVVGRDNKFRSADFSRDGVNPRQAYVRSLVNAGPAWRVARRA
jgi:WD40 repeat protein